MIDTHNVASDAHEHTLRIKHNASLAVNRLPDDVLSDILLINLPPLDQSDSLEYHRKHRRQLRHHWMSVSRRWRQVCVSTPDLWRWFFLSSPVLPHNLELERARAFHLVIHPRQPPIVPPRNLRDSLRPHLAMLRRLDLTGHFNDYLDAFNDPMPMLEYFKCTLWQSPADKLPLQHTPNLKQLEIQGMPPPLAKQCLPSFNPSHLTHLTLKATSYADEIWDFVGRSTSLTNLELSMNEPFKSTLPTLILPNLKLLSTRPASLTTHISAPHLHTLTQYNIPQPHHRYVLLREFMPPPIFFGSSLQILHVQTIPLEHNLLPTPESRANISELVNLRELHFHLGRHTHLRALMHVPALLDTEPSLEGESLQLPCPRLTLFRIIAPPRRVQFEDDTLNPDPNSNANWSGRTNLDDAPEHIKILDQHILSLLEHRRSIPSNLSENNEAKDSFIISLPMFTQVRRRGDGTVEEQQAGVFEAEKRYPNRILFEEHAKREW